MYPLFWSSFFRFLVLPCDCVSTRLCPPTINCMIVFVSAVEIDLGESVRAQRESWPPTDHEKNVLESLRAHRGALGLAENQGADESERTQSFVHICTLPCCCRAAVSPMEWCSISLSLSYKFNKVGFPENRSTLLASPLFWNQITVVTFAS